MISFVRRRRIPLLAIGTLAALFCVMIFGGGHGKTTPREAAAEELRVATIKMELLEATPGDYLESKKGETILVTWTDDEEIRYQYAGQEESDKVSIDKMAKMIVKVYKYGNPQWNAAARRYVRHLLPPDKRQ